MGILIEFRTGFGCGTIYKTRYKAERGKKKTTILGW